MDHVDTILSVVGLIVGLVALAFALPPFFQMMGGGPNVRVSFDESNEQGARFLLCRIHNLPIRNRALTRLSQLGQAGGEFWGWEGAKSESVQRCGFEIRL